MSNLQQFVNERLSAAAFEIWGAVEKALNEYREEVCYSKEENVRLQQLLVEMEIKYREDLQQITLPEHRQIKEEPGLRTSQWGEQLHEQQSDLGSDGKCVKFTSPSVVNECVERDSPYFSHLYQTVESREETPQIKMEYDGRAYQAVEPASDCLPPSAATSNCVAAQSSGQEDRKGLDPELNPIKSMPTQTKSGQSDPSSLDCRKTGYVKPTVEVLSGMERHVQDHPDFSDDSNLTGPVKIHTGARLRQYREEYDQRFAPYHNLITHMRRHAGETLHPCQHCGKGFSQKRYLLAHMKTHAKVKPHHCQECGKGFITMRDVRVHMRIHTGEKPYKCRECCKCFNHVGNLHVHMRNHTGEKPYWCQECNKSFRQKGHLDSHNMRTHRGETM